MTSPTRPRGFTLVEMLVALGASAVVIALAIGTAISQERTFYGSERLRTAQSSARAAQLFVEDKLRLAGFGTDPALTFDFQFYTPANYSTFPCPAQMGTCPRDSIANADELVFYARNPNYWVPNTVGGTPVGRAWRIRGTTTPDNDTGITSTSVRIDAHGGEIFPAGQILAAVCANGRYYAYMTVAATTPAQSPPPAAPVPMAAGPQTLTLAPVDTSNPFKRQDLALATGSSDTPAYFTSSGGALANPVRPSSCFSSGDARLFQIDRYRFHVRPVLVNGVFDPYLMLDMGVDTNLDGNVDANDELVIAEGVELMQVAYVLANPALPTPTVGTTAGTAITFTPGLPGSTATGNELTTVQLPLVLPQSFAFAQGLVGVDNWYAGSSWYPYSSTPPLPSNHPRMTDAVGNIRAVQLAFLVRSPEPDPQAPTNIVIDSSFTLLNLNARPAWIAGGQDGYQRAQVQSTVLVPNMTGRGMIYF